MKSLAVACLILFVSSPKGQAQLSDAQIVAGLRGRASTSEGKAREKRECENKAAYVAGSSLAGTAAGWLAFTFGIGLFASDHGSEYKKVRNEFMLSGALLGAGNGLFDVMATDCLRPPRPRGSRDQRMVPAETMSVFRGVMEPPTHQTHHK